MSPDSRSPINHLGRDVSGKIPNRENVPGMIEIGERDLAI